MRTERGRPGTEAKAEAGRRQSIALAVAGRQALGRGARGGTRSGLSGGEAAAVTHNRHLQVGRDARLVLG